MVRRKIDEPVAWHVIVRGARRLAIFRDDKDHRRWVERLDEACELSGLVPHAYCMMPNHYHLEATGTSGTLARAMHHVNRLYSHDANSAHDLKGRLFEAPYRAFVLQAPWRVVQVSRYIHLNPVAARMVKKPSEWAWSSYRAYAGERGELRTLRPQPILDAAGGRAAYLDQVVEAAETLPRKHALGSSEAAWESETAWLFRITSGSPPEGADPRALAVHLGSEAGIPKRVLTAGLGYSSAVYAGVVEARFRERLKKDAAFARRVSEWRRRMGL